jgi:ketosteroid isomerase-like protein
MRLYVLLLALLVALAPSVTRAQAVAVPAGTEQEVRAADAAFWTAFNACDAAGMGRYLAEDVEFYHDMTGLTRTRDALVESMMKGPCGTPGLRMRRQIVAGAKFDPVPGYGGVLSGDHDFYATRDEGREALATRARFVAVWRRDADGWRMTRILSLAHVPVAYQPPAARIVLTPAQLARYVGRYRTSAGDIEVRLDKDALSLSSGTMRVTLAAESPGHFFALERDLAFDFGEPAPERASTIQVRDNGAVVATGVRID